MSPETPERSVPILPGGAIGGNTAQVVNASQEQTATSPPPSSSRWSFQLDHLGEVDVTGPLLPFVISQGPHYIDGEAQWLGEKQRAPRYLDLLYDLAIAAVLSAFGSYHPISDGPSIVAYFAYFIIIWWTWASQVLYDTRFQANDWIHRLFKFLQLGAFAYVGVTAQGFDPRYVILPEDSTVPDVVTKVGGANSFNGVAIAYAIGRLLLMVQYLYITFVTPQKARRDRWHFFLIPSVSCLFSATLWFVAGMLTHDATAKLVLAYGGLAVEVLSAFGLWYLPDRISPSPTLMSERFADLTLVILAEGVLGIVESLASVVAGFGLATAGILNGYSTCVSALAIVSGTWHFIFHGFDPESSFKRPTLGAIWAILHLPLHFTILLLFSGMRNVAVCENIYGALMKLDTSCFSPLRLVSLNHLNTTVIDSQFDKLSTWTVQMEKLDLRPQFLDELDQLRREYSDPNPEQDPNIDALKYEAQIWTQTAESYEIKLANATEVAFDVIADASTVWIADNSTREGVELATQDLLAVFKTTYRTDLAQRSQFFLPCAGGLVLLAAALRLFRARGTSKRGGKPDRRYAELKDRGTRNEDATRALKVQRNNPSSGAWRWISFGIHTSVGVALCLLGFLDIGTPDDSSSSKPPVYTLLDLRLLLPIVAAIFAGLIITDCVTLGFARVASGATLNTDSPIDEDTMELQSSFDNPLSSHLLRPDQLPAPRTGRRNEVGQDDADEQATSPLLAPPLSPLK